MAVLSTADRERIWRGLMRLWSKDFVETDVSKSDLQTTINETDTWIDNNQSGYTSSLTHGASFTATQLTLMFCAVALARVSITFLRRVLGEVE